MENTYGSIIKDILLKVTFRYANLLPHGLEPDKGRATQTLQTKILSHGPARTLYVNRRPTCRSMDAVAPMERPGKTCAACDDRLRCTPQVYRPLFRPT